MDHTHAFGQQETRAGERRTLIVVLLTAVMMVAEVIAGIVYGSMALLADGLHMASHTAALGVAFAAYVLARRYATDRRYSFGSGKMNSLAAFTSAILLGLFTLVMAWESAARLLRPVAIAFDQAILVAIAGLVVNGISVWVLQGGHERQSHAGHDHDHHHGHDHDHHDHNLRAAYLHVLADALTSLLAIFALLGGKYLGWNWLDPLMGIAGAILVARWAMGLARLSSRVLLDRQAPPDVLADIRGALEAVGQTAVTDLHVWSIGPGIFAAEITLTHPDGHAPQHYRSLLHGRHGLVHLTVEVNRSAG
jgi:cation diffusion facilitator family transporter